MSQNTFEIQPTQFTPQEVGQIHTNRKPLLSRIISAISKSLRRFGRGDIFAYQHKSFVEENLLDQDIGYEISRTLRR